MTLPKFEYKAAHTIQEACNFAAEMGDKCVVMAGGTDVILLVQGRVILPEYVLDLKTIPGMDELTFVPGEGLTIGALTKLRAIELSPEVKKELPAVADAVHDVASTQIRCKGTLVGNICNASPSADTPPILIAMGATVETMRKTGVGRSFPIGDFFKGVKRTNLDKEEGELVTRVKVPALKPGEGSAYYKHAVRKAMDLAIVGVASWVKMDGKKIADCRIAVGGAAITPVRATSAEKLLIGQEYSDELLEKAAEATKNDIHPISDVRASAEYRIDMVRVFTKRSFKKALETLKA
jgi:carbon-monoxide dehydrogenase medium subunit